MLEKSSDEFECWKTHGFVRTAFGIGVSEKHPVVSHGDDTMIGDGGTEYVWREVADRTGAIADRLRVDIPAFFPGAGRRHVQQIGFFISLKKRDFIFADMILIGR